MTPLKTFLRRVRTLLWTAFSIIVVLAAVITGIGKLLMPYSDRYQPRLEAWLSEEFGQPVVVERLRGEWSAFGPRLSLQGMKLLPSPGSGGESAPPGEAEVVIESAALDIRPLSLLLPGSALYNFRVSGADFELTRDDGGVLRLSGFGVSRRGEQGGEQGGDSALAELLRVGEVVLEDSSLLYNDREHGIRLGFEQVDGRLHLQGEELSAEIRAELKDSTSGLVYGEVEAAVLLTLDEGAGLTGAAWHATLREFMLAAFQGRLPQNPFLPLTGWFNAELWGSWSQAQGHEVRGVSDLKEARLVNEYQDVWLERVNTRFRWGFERRGHWQLHLADFAYDDGERAWTAPRVSMARDTDRGLGLWISADRLPLQVPLRLTRDVLSIYGTPWPSFLPRSASGSVSDLDLVLDSRWRLEMARGELRQASVFEWDRWPDLQGFDGSVSLGRGSGRLRLDGSEVLIDWPQLFREQLSVAIPSCVIDLRWGDGWQVGIDPCAIENPDLAAHGSVTISGNTGKPAVDANVALTRGDIGALGPYWPESVLNDNVKSWLRGGLRAGRIEQGRVQIRGDMDDWPFRDGSGRFEAVALASGAHIDYVDDWPEVKEAELTARFVGASMDVRGRVGSIGGLGIPEARAAIADFAQPELTVEYAGDSSVPEILAFLQRTPLQQQIGVDLARFRFAGPASTRGRVTVPLGSSPGKLRVEGVTRLSSASFSDPELEITIEDIAGELAYSERGFSGRGLDAAFRGSAARLDLRADSEGAEKFRAELTGAFSVADVIPRFLLEDFSALSEARGAADWRFSLDVTRPEGEAETVAMLRLESGLEGVSLDLPAPLNKLSGEHWPLAFAYPLTGDQRVLDLNLADRLVMRFDMPEGAEAPRAAVIGVGGGPVELPAPGLVRIRGEGTKLDLDGWLDVVIEEAARGRSMGNLNLEEGRVAAGTLIFLDRRFEDVDMRFSVDGPDIRGQFESEDIDGAVRFTTGAGAMSSLTAEFERLALGEPISSGLDMDTNPAELPALHLYARSLRYRGMELGETRIEAYPIANGFHFEKIDAASDRMTVQAKGDWLLDEQGQRSDFDIDMMSESLGDFLRSLDIASPMEGGQTRLKFNAWWPGSPGAFALSKLNGVVEFRVIDGNISEANAGTGRLLGLLSVAALPKRLALDFRDVFDSGFSFDEATGTFDMQNGRALTDNLELKSSAANIRISGQTDLVERHFDQLMTIRPGVGNTLPIIGALAGGPGGAAAGLALQGLLHSQLAEATQVRYSIKGPWEDPQIEAVEVDRPAPPAEPVPAPPAEPREEESQG